MVKLGLVVVIGIKYALLMVGAAAPPGGSSTLNLFKGVARFLLLAAQFHDPKSLKYIYKYLAIPQHIKTQRPVSKIVQT